MEALSEARQLNFPPSKDKNLEKDPDNNPPFSRLFIVCSKTLSEEELVDQFKQFGEVEYCRLLRDKATLESKGICYVKYTKASSAARAIEEMDGKQVGEHTPQIKVQIADAKGSNRLKKKQYSKEPEDTPARSRLFVVCPKEMTEAQLTQAFEEFSGDLEYCKVITDRQSNESKGFAFAKFKKASAAAQAMEKVLETGEIGGMKVKVLIADPKAKRVTNDYMKGMEIDPYTGYPIPPMYAGGRPMAYPHYIFDPNQLHMGAYPMLHPSFQHSGIPMPGAAPGWGARSNLFVVCHKSVTQDQLMRLFGRFQGMEYCDLKKNKTTGESKGIAYINYSNPQSAALAKEQLDGIEFPSGWTMKVMFSEPLRPSISNSADQMAMLRDQFAGMAMGYSAPMMGVPYHPNMSQAQAIPHANGSGMGGSHHLHSPVGSPPGTNDLGVSPPQSMESAFYNGALTFQLTKPLAEANIRDIFVRFGELEYLQIEPDSAHGLVKYAHPSNGNYALQYLNYADLNGVVLTLQPITLQDDLSER